MKPKLLLYPNGPVADAIDAWLGGHGGPPESLRRYSQIVIDLHRVSDDLSLLPELEAAYPETEFILYCQPLCIDEPSHRTFPAGSFRDRQQKIVVKAQAFSSAVAYCNVDIRKCRSQLENLVNDSVLQLGDGASFSHRLRLFCDSMPTGYSADDARVWEDHLIQFARNTHASWMNTGGQFASSIDSFGDFFERFPLLCYDGTVGGALVNRVNGLLSHAHIQPIVFVCNLGADGAMPVPHDILRALVVAQLTGAMLVAGTSNGSNRPDAAPLPVECTTDYGTWGDVVRDGALCYSRKSDTGAVVAGNFGHTTQMVVALSRQLAPAEFFIGRP